MITQPAKVFLPLTALGFVAAVVYSVFTGDHTGITLFFSLAGAAMVGGLTVTVARENEVAPAVAADAGPPEFRSARPVRLPGGPGWPALAAIGVGFTVLSFITGPLFAIPGVGLLIFASIGWLASVASDRTRRSANLMPLGIPVVGLFAIFSLMFFMSRILLAVPEQASTFVALAVAVVIMTFGSFIALKPSISSRVVMAGLVIGGLVLIGGGITAAAVGQRKVEEHGPHEQTVTVIAKAVAFNQKELMLHSGAEADIKFENQDTVPHNIAIYATEAHTGPALFQGPVIVGGETADYHFPAPPPGTYYFRCDIHPTVMTGKVTVA
jgi:plastocyanin